MVIEVGQEYIDRRGNIYTITSIDSNSVIIYSVAMPDSDVIFSSGSTYVDSFKNLIKKSFLFPNTLASKVLYKL